MYVVTFEMNNFNSEYSFDSLEECQKYINKTVKLFSGIYDLEHYDGHKDRYWQMPLNFTICYIANEEED